MAISDGQDPSRHEELGGQSSIVDPRTRGGADEACFWGWSYFGFFFGWVVGTPHVYLFRLCRQGSIMTVHLGGSDDVVGRTQDRQGMIDVQR
jgi:hypothetical protein